MAEHPNERERISEREHTTHVTERSSGTGIAAVVGGLVVAVLVIFWLIGGFEGGGTEVSETSITVEETETAAGTDTATGEESSDAVAGTGTEAETAPEANAETAPAPEPEGAADEPAEEPAATE